MSSKRTEFGRSLVETLAVLAIMAILTLVSVTGYNFMVRKYKQNQTVKAISEMAVRYKLRPTEHNPVYVKTIYPEADIADAVSIRTADTTTGRVMVEVSNENPSYFTVVVNQILDVHQPFCAKGQG